MSKILVTGGGAGLGKAIVNALLAGEETDPLQLAEFVAFLLENKPRHKYLTGCVLPYGA